MSNQVVSPLRRRMIEDMTIRHFSAKTQADYIRAVRTFAGFLGQSPDQAEPEDLRRFQLHMAAQGASPATMNAAVSALRFFFSVTLGWVGFGDRLATVRAPERLPVVLSPEEVARLLGCAPGLKDRAALSIAYGCGLRVSEIIHLKVSDVDSARMLIRVEQGKGRKDRVVMLAPDLLDLLRHWWKVTRSRGWLFPGREPGQPITARQLNRACHAAAASARLDKRVSMHTLRHSFATHLLEQKIDIRVIHVLLGHRKLDTTALYTRVAVKTLRAVASPLSQLRPKDVPPV
jgi:site-specific recombinase XerD